MVGKYLVTCVGPAGMVKFDFAIGTFRVIPEIPLGVIVASMVGLLGLAVFRRFKMWP
jgi:hypothetical protein